MASNSADLKEDVLRFYKDAGLEPVAKEAGLLDSNGELAGFTQTSKGIQMIAVPIQQSPSRTHIVSRQNVLGSGVRPQHVTTAQLLASSPASNAQQTAQWTTMSPATVVHGNGGGRKRTMDNVLSSDVTENFERAISAASKVSGGRGHKGLRHFSTKVCEKVQEKGVTTYGEVADELVRELNDPYFCQYDQKNIRRRVYDALNVLMAMNIISKEKKEIKWIGLPTNSAQEVANLETEKKRRCERIKHKTQQLQELILQQIAFKNLVERNREQEQKNGNPTSNSAIQLPYIIVNTSKKTVIDCSISNDKFEYLFNFDNTFEIHDDIEVLKRMGMALGLEKQAATPEDVRKAIRMVPKALEPYVLELANPNHSRLSSSSSHSNSLLDSSMDAEVAVATRGLSRQSSFTSRDTPTFTDDSDSDPSSPVDIT